MTTNLIRLVAMLFVLTGSSTGATVPTGPTNTRIVKLDGVPLSSQSPSAPELSPTFHYDFDTRTLHMWVQLAHSPTRSLTDIRHATSMDGINFVSAGDLLYSGSPWAGTPWGVVGGEPAMIHPKISRWLSRYKLLLWTYVAPSGEGPWGDYSNNISVNDIGLDLNNLVVEHEGPIGPLSGGILGQTAGSFGIVEPVHYLESNMFLGRAFLTEVQPGTTFAPPQSALTGPYRLNGTVMQVMDMVHTLPQPISPALNCLDSGSPRYGVHNDARMLENPDHTLGILYSIRDCATGSRVNQQLYYAESWNTTTWSDPMGIFIQGATVNVEGIPTPGNFSMVDFVVVGSARVIYFSATDVDGNYVVVSEGLPVPARLLGAVSRKVHGAAGTFDLPLSLSQAQPTIEPRQGPDAEIIMTFDKEPVTSTLAVTDGIAMIGMPTRIGGVYNIPITGVAGQQYVTVSVYNIVSTDGAMDGSGSVRIGFLAGDVTQNGVVTLSDLAKVNAQLSLPVTAANYLKDVNASGTLTIADKGITNANLTKALPPP